MTSGIDSPVSDLLRSGTITLKSTEIFTRDVYTTKTLELVTGDAVFVDEQNVAEGWIEVNKGSDSLSSYISVKKPNIRIKRYGNKSTFQAKAGFGERFYNDWQFGFFWALFIPFWILIGRLGIMCQ